MAEKEIDLERLMSQVFICFESSHNEQVQIEAVQYSGFIDKLVQMNFKIGMVKKAPITVQKLTDYNILIIGNPKERSFTPEEIDEITNFVYQGGGLLLINDQGGDLANRNNLSKVGQPFGLSFNSDILVDKSAELEEDEQLVVTSKFFNHFIMRGIDTIALKSSCSIQIIEGDPRAEPNAVAFAMPSASNISWNGTNWVEIKSPKNVVIAVSKFGAGKVVALGTTRILSSLINKKHGFLAGDNEKVVSNIFAWLVNREVYEEGKLNSVFVNISLKPDVYFWVEKELKENDKFRDFNEVINFALESLAISLEKYRESK
ncbi:MAG: hypothetical protein ACTSUE_04270 [Promethearchaeota archaeon]